jgi:hypothetical protein
MTRLRALVPVFSELELRFELLELRFEPAKRLAGLGLFVQLLLYDIASQ